VPLQPGSCETTVRSLALPLSWLSMPITRSVGSIILDQVAGTPTLGWSKGWSEVGYS
jgi:hypothetical protein